MNSERDLNVLTINSGSSSVKVRLYRIGETETCRVVASVDRIGSSRSRVSVRNIETTARFDQEARFTAHKEALKAVLNRIDESGALSNVDAVGHRVVVGDKRCIEPQIIGDQLLATFQELVDLAPDHLPQIIDEIAEVGRSYPATPQVACFDSAFHRRMPPQARMYALPRRFFEEGILRYGFHGLSFESIMQTLLKLDPTAAQGRIVVAHLGNGSSITAIRDGASIDTSMGFTPLAGLMMGTRCGDLDPGALLYLMNQEGMTFSALNHLLNRESGLLGVSAYGADMRDLIERERRDTRCAEAIAMFCYQAKKFIGAYTAVLGGLDTLVFTGGIGEHSAVIRERICAGMDCVGIKLDAAANASDAPMISADTSDVAVRVIETNEDAMIARYTWRVVANNIS